MNYFIKIERVPYEEPYHLELHWTIGSHETTSIFEIYHNAEDLQKFASALTDFPKDSKDRFLFELGSEETRVRFAYFYRFDVKLKNSRGHDAQIDVRFVNNREHADTRIVDFALFTITPRIRALGNLFGKFSELNDRILYWDHQYEFTGSMEEFKSKNWIDE